MAEYDISLDGLNTDPNLRIPENQNPTQNTYFKLDFLRLPNTTYFCQGINLPAVTVGDIKQMTSLLHMPHEPVNYPALPFCISRQLLLSEERHLPGRPGPGTGTGTGHIRDHQVVAVKG